MSGLHLYHCADARSFRALWALEELGLDYELTLMPFPPRFRFEGYKDVNPLGTVPALLVDAGREQDVYGAVASMGGNVNMADRQTLADFIDIVAEQLGVEEAQVVGPLDLGDREAVDVRPHAGLEVAHRERQPARGDRA